MSTAIETSPALLEAIKTLPRRQQYEIASEIISDINSEWLCSDDTQKWQDANVSQYEASMSFDELAAEIRSVLFY